ncbi:2Fe-2S iron-sulfur cluster-binding protein [Streptomyces sp. NK08204]|uniref:2Fe-2S iron-sulfur cluster-binding protein n=1 Tax=Streptomyces sp. NK08204 TaxID=2873260 RepID=UPI001CEDE9E1|nr:2Fe-2S iron-sulfur cluster-binding protein [Streptomyces sp. NK08204]
MTDDQHGEGTPHGGGRWDPLPQGDYDDGATAFVKLPEGGIDALLSGDSPLAAPGHGYVPPAITTAPADGSAGAWPVPESAQWPDPNAVPQEPVTDDRFTYHPGATQQWTFEEPAAPPASGHDVTGQWSIPVAGGDLPDESGEFTTAALVEQWGGPPPATLPGGAPAPWATDGAGQAWDRQQVPAQTAEPSLAQGVETPAHGTPAPEGHAPAEPFTEPFTEPFDEPFTEPFTEETGEHAPEAAPERPADGPTHPEAPAAPATVPETVPETVETPEAAAPAAPDAPAGAPDTPDVPAAQEAPGTAGTPETSAPAQEPGTPAASPSADVSGQPAADAPEQDTSQQDAPHQDAAPAEPAPQQDAAPQEPEEPAAAPLLPHDDHPLASYVLRVNGTDRPVTDAWIGESLLYVLRERLGLAGAKDGCSQGECGACNVQVDGRLVASCLVPAATAAGSEVRTVEGLAVDGQPSDVQRALARCGAVQCGFCVPGMAMTVHDLLEGNPAPTELETRQALCGNLCRCSGYRGVVQAVQEVVAEREAHTAADSATDGGEPRIPHQAGPGSGGVNPSAFEAPGVFDSPGTFGAPAPHDQHYGQDGGQA